MGSKFFHGTSILSGDSTVPGVELPDDLKNQLPTIFKTCKDFGLDYYPTVVQMLSYDEISEIASYGGFPVRYPHWQFGMEYEELQRGYEHGMHRIYEMVVNTLPCYIYCLDSNTLVDNVTVVAHALGHNDFFKNNIFFSQTNQNMMNKLATHGTLIRKYIARWGKERVGEFIDHCLRVQTLIDTSNLWKLKEFSEPVIYDSRKWEHPRRVEVGEGHEYMENYLNPKDQIRKQQDKINRREAAVDLGISGGGVRDIMGFLKNRANLKPWQADILAMLYEEAMYFAPQGMTKMLNEGWASYIDHCMMCRKGLVGLGQKGHDYGIIEYALHKMGVLGGKYSVNPYKLGFCLFLDIEERWNKGRFGDAYEDCTDMNKKNEWDQNLNLGHEKVFEVRKHYNDVTALMEYFTPEFCNKYEFFNWKRYPNGDIKVENRDFEVIRKNLLRKYTNRGLPDIVLADANHRGKGIMLLEHRFEQTELYFSYAEPVLQSLAFLWGNTVCLTTKNRDEDEVILICHDSTQPMIVMNRKEYENTSTP